MSGTRAPGDAHPAGAAVRCFVALPVPAHVRVLLEAARAPARDATPGLTWTRPEGWHLTLAFVGELPHDALDLLGDVVTEVAAEAQPVELSLGGAGRFADHTLWIGVHDDPDGAVAALGERLQTALAGARLPVRQRRVRPHLTLARGGRGRRGPVTGSAVAAVPDVGARWEADHVVVMRSLLGAGPARYEPLRSAPLGPPTPSPGADPGGAVG